ncbi:MBL fold metallo-hydrolase [uncultured Jatrophihabitans sp.]|uniref:MBL fold metallo-hydrolase n=1 Tax=uncultured Jatrophihabitans sp. TaxID=1610747 RepID=UPI0035CC385A
MRLRRRRRPEAAASEVAFPAYGTLRAVTPRASVLLQRNPGPMSLEGTNSWVVGARDAAERILIDPGEDSENHPGADHLERLLSAAPSVSVVLLTHGHHDHSGLAARLHEQTGVAVRAADPALCRGGPPLRDGAVVDASGVRLQVLATPGHTADSVSFVLAGSDDADGAAVFTGDTVLGRGTTVVAHPDGALGPYLASLRLLQGLGGARVLPGHGPELDSIGTVAAEYLAHRAERLEQVRSALQRLGPSATAREIVEDVYADVDPAVWWAAELSVAAQLDYLRR